MMFLMLMLSGGVWFCVCVSQQLIFFMLMLLLFILCLCLSTSDLLYADVVVFGFVFGFVNN